MDEAPEIRNLGDGKYSFLVGRQRYTLTTPLDEERFVRIVTAIRDLVASFPPTLSRERLLLALIIFLTNSTTSNAGSNRSAKLLKKAGHS